MFKKINPYEAQGNVFDMIGKQKMLIVAGDGTKVNGMTASWGALGVIWGAPAAYAFVRDSRYTKEFLDGSETFSLCFFGKGYEECTAIWAPFRAGMRIRPPVAILPSLTRGILPITQRRKR